jgi:hypothetical protein
MAEEQQKYRLDDRPQADFGIKAVREDDSVVASDAYALGERGLQLPEPILQEFHRLQQGGSIHLVHPLSQIVHGRVLQNPAALQTILDPQLCLHTDHPRRRYAFFDTGRKKAASLAVNPTRQALPSLGRLLSAPELCGKQKQFE